MAEEQDTPYQIANRVGVIGLGYVGLPLALLLVQRGLEVVGIDTDCKKIKNLEKGESYLNDIENLAIEEALLSRRFLPTNQYSNLKNVDYIIICVPTPLNSFYEPDLTYLQQVGDTLSKHLSKGQLVILESSTYPGTTREFLMPLLEKSRLKVGSDIFLAFSPERIDPGNKDFLLSDIPKVLSGVTNECSLRAHKFYSKIFRNIVLVSTPETAEMSKILENSYRYINISFINEIATICETMKIDVWEVIEAAKTKPYGFTPFYPGPGVGGHCIPIDPLYLLWKAKEYGLSSKFIELSDEINRKMPSIVVNKLKQLLSPKLLKNSNILIYGVAYKRDINDNRQSSSIEIIKLLDENDVNVAFHDPYISSIKINNKELKSIEFTEEELKKADVVILLTDHSRTPVQYILEHSSVVFDTRNMTRGLSGNAKVFRFGGGNG